jgi:hypothetical protein
VFKALWQRKERRWFDVLGVCIKKLFKLSIILRSLGSLTRELRELGLIRASLSILALR